MNNLTDTYIAHLTNVRRLSELTCKSYRTDIQVLLRQLESQFQCHAFNVVQPHHIRQIIAQLHSNGLSGRSLARMLSAWRSFYTYLIRHHQHTQNPCTGIRVPKSSKKLPHALSPDETTQLLAFSPNSLLAIRDSAMFELFYSSGLRLAELAALALTDIDFTEETVRVHGKGNKTRIIPVGKLAIQALKTWIKQRASILQPDTNALFLSQHGKAISPRTISYRLKIRAQQQNLYTNVHPHVLRHSFASHILQSSGDLRAVQEMLGHASITSTQVYTHLDFQHLTKVYDAAHPRAKKKNR